MRVEEPGLLRERIHCEAAIGDLGVRRYSSVGPKAWRRYLGSFYGPVPLCREAAARDS